MRKRLWMALSVVLVLFVGTGVVLLAYLSHGVSARDTPLPIEAFVARKLRHFAIPREARKTRNPVPLTPNVLAEGMAHFADHCATCHANDGSGMTEMGQNLYPKAPDMRLPRTQRLSDGELFYIIQNGIRFTGMPAWGTGRREHEMASWHLVHFIRHLPRITSEEIAEMERMNPKSLDEIQEEAEAEKFLRGEENPQTTPMHHH